MSAVKKKVVNIGEAVRKRVEEEKRGGGGGGGTVDSKFVRECLKAESLGDGLLFAELNKQHYLYHKALKLWLAWKGHHWSIDTMDRAIGEGVERVAARYLQESDVLVLESREAEDKGKTDAAKYLKGLSEACKRRASNLRKKTGRAACIEFAHTSTSPLAITGEELDINPWLLPCANGVIDLRTGEIRDGRPEDYMMRASPVSWAGIDAPCPTWEEALLAIMDGRQDMVDYLRRLFGYAATGLSTEHLFAVLYGLFGRNGKSTIVETISAVLGNLAEAIPPEMLLAQRGSSNPGGPSPHIMHLRGLRIAFASETEDGERFSCSKVKWFTGGDSLVGRDLNAKHLTPFQPTHTLFLLTNHFPHAPADDAAFWERLQLIDFPLSFVARKPVLAHERPRDAQLRLKLQAEYPGILAWIVRGCLEWQRDGLNPPAAVLEATKDKRRAEDILADFFEARCEVWNAEVEAQTGARRDDYYAGATELYEEFADWWKQEVNSDEKRVPKQRRFGTWMGKRIEFEKIKDGGTYWYYGLRLKKGSDQHKF